MKKFIFSAVALLEFSFASMVNDSVKKENKETEKTENKIEEEKSCGLKYLDDR